MLLHGQWDLLLLMDLNLKAIIIIFSHLIFPESHPARDSQDTFYIKDQPHWSMRPHTSNMQARLIKKYGTPLRAIIPGRVYRNEAIDATHEHTFHQVEGLVIDKDITIGHLIGTLQALLSGLYNREITVRLRPGYFPFVEPGFGIRYAC